MQIARFLFEIAKQEDGHAKTFLSFLDGKDVLEVTTSFQTKKLGLTLENLKSFAEVEHYVHSVLYPEFARVADKEGFKDVAKIFRAISIAEKRHEDHFGGFAEKLENGTLFKREEPVEWFCTECGYSYNGKYALDQCPACNKPKGYFSTTEVY